MKIKKLNKFKLFSLLGAGLLATSSTLILASCSSGRQKLINDSVLTNGLGKFTDGIDLKTMSSSLLKNNTTAQTNLADIAAGLFAYKWIESLSTKDKKVKNALDAKKKSINKSYDDALKDYKKKYSTNYDIHFQQEFLDKNGGNEEAYKQIELNKWAKQYFIDNVFATDVYVKLMNNNSPVIGGNLNTSELKKVFNDTASEKNSGSTYKFAFQANDNSDYAEKEYASFQQFIYDQWVQYTNPFLVNNILWKYGEPPSGSSLSDYYLISTTSGDSGDSGDSDSGGDSSGGDSGGDSSSGGESTKNSSIKRNSNLSSREESGDSGSDGDSSGEEGDTSTPSTSAGSYIYPFFSSSIPSNNNTTSTVKKYQDFVTLATTANTSGSSQQVNANETSQATTNSKVEDSNGLKKNLSQYSDDYATTLMLVKNSTSYSDLTSVQLAAAASFMLYKDATLGGSSGGNSVQSLKEKTESNPITNKNNISKQIATAWTTTNIDPITDEFIWSNTSSGGGSGSGGGGGGGSAIAVSTSSSATTTGSNNSAFTNNAAKVTLSSQLVNEIISSKNLSSYRDKSLTSVDGFLASNLSGFIFIRDNDGVRAISIEGGAYINKATTIADLKTRAGNVVLFHYMNNLNGNDDTSIGTTSIDLKTELSSYLTNNFDYLILEYAKKIHSSSNGVNTLNTVENSIPKIDSVFTNSNEKTLIENLVKYNFEVSISKRKEDYRQKMYDAKSTYSSNFGIDAKKNGLAAPWIYGIKSNASIYDYELIDTVPTADPFANDSGSKKNFENSVQNFTNSLTTQTSSFSGHKYSQYVYSNNILMNYVLMNSDEIALSAIVRAGVYNTKWKELYKDNDYKYNGFKTSTSNMLSTKTDANTLNTYVDNALNNYFFSSVFDNLTTGRWLKYNELTKSSTASSEKQDTGQNNQFDVTKLRTYRKNLWLENIKNNNIDSFNSMLTVYATIDYLAKDNFKEFIDYLKTKITYGNDAYITWTNSINESIYLENNPPQQQTQTSANGTTSNLLDQKNLLSASNIKQNVDNGYFSGYIGNSLLNSSSTVPPISLNKIKQQTTTNTELKNNTQDSLFNVSANYYKISNNMLGFDGIQTSASNSLPTTIQDVLFNKPTNYNPEKKGLFYSFESREKLIEYINKISTISQANELADLIKNRTGFDTADIKNDIYDLNQKKQALLTLTSNNNKNGNQIITDEMFQPRDGIQTKEKQAAQSPSTSSSTNINNLIENSEQGNEKIKYAANVIQLNFTDVSSYEKLSKRISDSKAITTDTSQSTIANGNQNNDADEVIMNLLVHAVVNDSTLQNRVVLKLSEENKMNVYDVRLNSGLGFNWVLNWKE